MEMQISQKIEMQMSHKMELYKCQFTTNETILSQDQTTIFKHFFCTTIIFGQINLINRCTNISKSQWISYDQTPDTQRNNDHGTRKRSIGT